MPDPLKHLRHRERPLKSRWIKPAPPVGGPPPTPPTHDLEIIAGTPPPDPDVTGYYDQGGTYNGQPWYGTEGSTTTLYYDTDQDKWLLVDSWSIELFLFKRTTTGTDPTGTYEPIFGCTGQPIAQVPV